MKYTITTKYEGWENLQAYALCYKYLFLALSGDIGSCISSAQIIKWKEIVMNIAAYEHWQ